MQEAHSGTMEAPQVETTTAASWKFRRHSGKSSQMSTKFYDRQEQEQEQDDDDDDDDEGQLVARDPSIVGKSFARRFQWRRHSKPVDDFENAGQPADDVKLDRPLQRARPPVEDDANIEQRKLVSSVASSTDNKRRAPLLFRLMNYQMHEPRAPSFNDNKHHRSHNDHSDRNTLDQHMPVDNNHATLSIASCPKQIRSNRSSLLLLLSLSLPALFTLVCLTDTPAWAAATSGGAAPATSHQSHRSSDDKRAAAELIARRLLSTYYQTHLLGQQHQNPASSPKAASLLQHRQPAQADERQQERQQYVPRPIGDDHQPAVQERQWQVDHPTSPADRTNHQHRSQAPGAAHRQSSAASSWTINGNIDSNSYQQHPAAGEYPKAENALVPAGDNHLYHGLFLTGQQHQADHRQQQQQQQHQHAFVSYRTSLVPKSSSISDQPAPTTPTLNKQLVPPPSPHYELSLAPTSTLQLGPATAPSSSGHQDQQQQHHHHHHLHHGVELLSTAASGMDSVVSSSQPADYYAGHLRAAESAARARQQAATASLLQELPSGGGGGANSTGVATTRQQQQGQRQATRGSRQYSGSADSSSQSNDASAESTPAGQTSDSKYDQNSGQQSQSQSQQQQQQHTPVEKDVEPRQRRRMFNRILKKAEWNHLFVELSKVFLRYFLDLALKDMIGNKSGTDSSSSLASDSSTTGRKKLDAQSELANLLKEFVKTAVSNM